MKRIDVRFTATLGLLLIGVYAAIHIGLVLAEREWPGLGVLAGVAFMLLEYTSMANLVMAHGRGLRLSAAATYVLLLVTLGGMRELHFGAGNSWLTARALAWWATACGCGAATQVAFALRETALKAEADEAEQRAQQRELQALELQLRSQERIARAQQREETKRQLAVAEMQMAHARPPTSPRGVALARQRQDGNGLPSQQRRQRLQQLQQLLQDDPYCNLHQLAPTLGCSVSTLSRDARALGFVLEDGRWQRNGDNAEERQAA
ncbi:MAG: hypothetical protein QHJ81_14725 [Anaerolineae bacterium]|nr:hypothetical protein [Anaerolineae bacterium]